jgi:exosortase/archaeosortase family protein
MMLRQETEQFYVFECFFRLKTAPTTKKTTPNKTKISAKSIILNKYRIAPIHRSSMPSNSVLDAKSISSGNLILYVSAAIMIILTIYYIPDYFFLEKATADHTALFLNAIGISVQSTAFGNAAFISEIQIVKDCTGIQVLAVFLGLIVPLPNASLKKKAVSLLVVSSILYSANVIRIALEFWLVYFGILPWSLAHYPLSLALGIVGVLLLVLVTNRFLPEFGNFIFEATKMKTLKQNA